MIFFGVICWHVSIFLGEEKYSLVLEYVDGGTLRKYLRDDTITFKWENQLKFAKEIASAISWLHGYITKIIRGDLVSIFLWLIYI